VQADVNVKNEPGEQSCRANSPPTKWHHPGGKEKERKRRKVKPRREKGGQHSSVVPGVKIVSGGKVVRETRVHKGGGTASTRRAGGENRL